MDLIDKLRSIADRISKLKNQVETEEATKNAFVMPFISALGYDVFNPTEVIPEFIADIGIKKGEKVDYCIQKDGQPIIIIECKHWREALNPHNSQLFRYFHVTKTRFSILTNGIDYWFYSDLVEANKMDEKPFLEFSLEAINETTVGELKRFQKSTFNVDEIVGVASDLKYSKELKEVLANEFVDPSEEFVKFLSAKVYPGRITAKVLEQFKGLVVRSTKTLLSEMISERLQTVLDREKEDRKKIVDPEPPETSAADQSSDSAVETTEEELQGYLIVKAILRKHVEVQRIALRDSKTYCSILLDDNNRKPVCRLWFNRSQKYIGVFKDKTEEKIPVNGVDDIYSLADKLVESVLEYEGKGG
jgi:hypothetical protein